MRQVYYDKEVIWRCNDPECSLSYCACCYQAKKQTAEASVAGADAGAGVGVGAVAAEDGTMDAKEDEQRGEDGGDERETGGANVRRKEQRGKGQTRFRRERSRSPHGSLGSSSDESGGEGGASFAVLGDRDRDREGTIVGLRNLKRQSL